MPFEPFTWVIGYAFSRGITKSLDNATAKTLDRELNKAVTRWCKKLPKDLRFLDISLLIQVFYVRRIIIKRY